MAQGIGFRSLISDFSSGTCRGRFLAFCENIIKKNNKLKYSNWIEFRKNKIKNNKSKLIVHNKDFLAIKI